MFSLSPPSWHLKLPIHVAKYVWIMVNFLIPKYSLILKSWLLKLIIGASTLSATKCSTRLYMRSNFLYLAYYIYTQLRTDGKTSSDMLSSRYHDGNRGVDDTFFIMHMNVIFLKLWLCASFSCVLNQLSTLRDWYVVETTVFCLKYNRVVQFLLNFAMIQCLLKEEQQFTYRLGHCYPIWYSLFFLYIYFVISVSSDS